MKKIRYHYWLLQTLLRKHFLIILGAAVVGAISTTQAPRLVRLLPKPKPTHYIGRVGVYTLATLPRDIQTLVSSGLTTISPDGTPLPALARDWKIIDDGRTYIFNLHDDLYWQDGARVTSRDINYSFQDVVIETPDDFTVVFKLNDRYSPFPGIVSQPLFKRITKTFIHTLTSTQIVGTGDYSITNLKRNGNFLQEITLDSKEGKRVYRFYNTERAAVTAFKLGHVDALEDMTAIYELAQWDSVTTTTNLNLYRYAALYFNTSDPNLAQKPIRQALSYTVPDKPSDDTRTLGPISPLSWAYNPKVKAYGYSPNSAQELFKEFDPSFEIEISTTPSFVSLAESIKASWEQLGITVRVSVSNFPDTNNFQVLLIGQQIPKDPDQYQLWHSTQSTNLTHYNNAKVDKLLEDGRKELDQNKRKIIYQDFQRFLLEDSPAAFLFFLPTTNVYRHQPLF